MQGNFVLSVFRFDGFEMIERIGDVFDTVAAVQEDAGAVHEEILTVGRLFGEFVAVEAGRYSDCIAGGADSEHDGPPIVGLESFDEGLYGFFDGKHGKRSFRMKQQTRRWTLFYFFAYSHPGR